MTTDPQMPVEELEGRELDEAVHREVFGWEFDESMWEGHSEAVWSEDEEYAKCHPTAAPLYSSEIAAAWTIIADIDWWGWELNGAGDSGLVVCYLNPSGTPHRAEAETAPTAICRAALRAVRQ